MRHHFARQGGRFINPLDDAQRRRVVFLGYSLAEDLFGEEDPVAQTISIDRGSLHSHRRDDGENADGGPTGGWTRITL